MAAEQSQHFYDKDRVVEDRWKDTLEKEECY